MYLCSCTREQMLYLLPRQGVVAEIGTAKGAFAANILQNADPQVLHLIDPWIHHTQGAYTRDRSNVGEDEQEQRYTDILKMFETEIDEGRVVVHRETSAAAASSFADGELDWVYVDGLHTFDGTLADLTVFSAKLKSDGFLIGHDYTNNPVARQQDFGVVEAVNLFAVESEFDLIAMTLEAFPSYLMARPGERTNLFVASLFHAGAVVAEIDGYPASGTFFHRAYEIGGRRGVVPVFEMPAAKTEAE